MRIQVFTLSTQFEVLELVSFAVANDTFSVGVLPIWLLEDSQNFLHEHESAFQDLHACRNPETTAIQAHFYPNIPIYNHPLITYTTSMLYTEY